MEERFYEKENITVRRSVRSDVEYLKDHLKQADIDEIYAASHSTPEEALTSCLEDSVYCWTVSSGVPFMIFGIGATSLLDDKACVFMLSSKDVEKIKKRFLKGSREFVDIMLGIYPKLFNFVDARHTKSIAWLTYLGAELQEAKPHGIEGLPFHYFEFNKELKDDV